MRMDAKMPTKKEGFGSLAYVAIGGPCKARKGTHHKFVNGLRFRYIQSQRERRRRRGRPKIGMKKIANSEQQKQEVRHSLSLSMLSRLDPLRPLVSLARSKKLASNSDSLRLGSAC